MSGAPEVAVLPESTVGARSLPDDGLHWFIKLIHADGVSYLAEYRAAVGRARPRQAKQSSTAQRKTCFGSMGGRRMVPE